jgi:hypothetical protein
MFLQQAALLRYSTQRQLSRAVPVATPVAAEDPTCESASTAINVSGDNRTMNENKLPLRTDTTVVLGKTGAKSRLSL